MQNRPLKAQVEYFVGENTPSENERMLQQIESSSAQRPTKAGQFTFTGNWNEQNPTLATCSQEEADLIKEAAINSIKNTRP